MRIKLEMTVPDSKELRIPLRGWQRVIQGFVYSHLDEALSVRLHDHGARPEYSGQPYRLFTFSKLGGGRIKDGALRFSSEYGRILTLQVAAADKEILTSLAAHLIGARDLTINGTALHLTGMETVENPVEASDAVKLRTLAPIAAYSSSPRDSRNTNKHEYRAPGEEAWLHLLRGNLCGKRAALGIVDHRGSNGEEVHISPAENCPPKKVVAFPKKGVPVESYEGILQAYLPRPYLDIALDTGLGAKNSMGFGMVEVIEA